MVYPPNPADEALIAALERLHPAHAESVRAYEAELDVIWPQWRDASELQARGNRPSRSHSFRHVEYDLQARIKWLLKRRLLLLTNDHGRPTPRDWEVLITPSASGKMCFAHAIMPADTSREATTNPPSPLRVHPEVST